MTRWQPFNVEEGANSCPGK